MDNDLKYMNLALELALKARGFTLPNPLVGAAIVKNNSIIARGFHKKAGQDHAEIIALRKAGRKAKGATLYVTLEPCSTFGRTPPCTDSIINAGIKKVVIGMVDPNPIHNKKSIDILKKKGIKVVSGVLKDRIRQINQPFIKFITKGIPYVTVKIAQSIDGKIATKNGNSKWITSLASRRFAHKLRNDFDAIMVGINTILTDNPILSPTDKRKKYSFYKVILDTELKINPNLNIFKHSLDFPVIIATSKEAIIKNNRKIKSLIKKNAIILGIEKENNFLGLKYLLNKLAQLDITNLLVEGGGKLIGSLSDQRLIDRILFFIAPKIIGGKDSISSIQGQGIEKITKALNFRETKLSRIKEDLLIEGIINEY